MPDLPSGTVIVAGIAKSRTGLLYSDVNWDVYYPDATGLKVQVDVDVAYPGLPRLGDYHSIAEYDPVHDVFLIGGGNNSRAMYRVAIVAGVIGAHVSVIYALDVSWWYEERTASAAATAVLAGVFSPGLLFGMGLLFFVAGLFTPTALGRKGVRRFVLDRLWRLGIPTAAYLFVVNPALNFVGDRAMGLGETV